MIFNELLSISLVLLFFSFSWTFLLNDDQFSGTGETPDFWRSQAKRALQKKRDQPRIENRAKNVVMFVGSGLGVASITAARILKGQIEGHSGEESMLAIDNFPYSGFSKTYCQDSQVADTAAAAAAYFCGVKANLGVIGVDARVTRGDCENQKDAELTSILDWSIQRGKSVGLVTVSRVTEATSASLYAHAADVRWEGDVDTRDVTGGCKDIAAQLIDDYPQIQVVLGGGRRYFMRADQRDPEHGSNTQYGRADNRDLIEEWKQGQHFLQRRYSYVWNAEEFRNIDHERTDSVLGLFESSRMQIELDRTDPNIEKGGEPSLEEMTEAAIKILRRNPEGFFLMVEGGNIGKGHSEGHAKVALYEALAFDRAVAMATKLTAENDTLIVVTSDHSDGMSIAGYPTRGNSILGKVDDGSSGYSYASDGMPYTTLLYATGPGYHGDDGHRPDITNVDTTVTSYEQQSAVYMNKAVGGGDDVGIYARGPWAHLFTGTHEQNDIAHVMAYASCVGDDTVDCPPESTSPELI